MGPERVMVLVHYTSSRRKEAKLQVFMKYSLKGVRKRYSYWSLHLSLSPSISILSCLSVHFNALSNALDQKIKRKITEQKDQIKVRF